MKAQKGERIRERTEEEQALYDELMPRLLAGESPIALARAAHIPVARLEKWKHRAKRRIQRDIKNMPALPQRPDVLPGFLPQAQDALPTQGDGLLPAETDAQRRFALEQVQAANAWLGRMRNGTIERNLDRLQESIGLTLDKLIEVTNKGTKLVHSAYQGEMNFQEVAMSLGDYRDGASAIKAMLGIVSDLYMLPLQSQNVNAFSDKQQNFTPHLHLHSHGGRDKEPSKVAFAVPTTEAPIASTLDPLNAEILAELSVDDIA